MDVIILNADLSEDTLREIKNIMSNHGFYWKAPGVYVAVDDTTTHVDAALAAQEIYYWLSEIAYKIHDFKYVKYTELCDFKEVMEQV